MIAEDHLDTLDPEQLRQALRAVRAEIALKDELLARREREVAFKQSVIDKLTHENAVLKRLKFAAKSEANTAEQKSLLEESWTWTSRRWPPRSKRCSPRASPPWTRSNPSARCCHRT